MKSILIFAILYSLPSFSHERGYLGEVEYQLKCYGKKADGEEIRLAGVFNLKIRSAEHRAGELNKDAIEPSGELGIYSPGKVYFGGSPRVKVTKVHGATLQANDSIQSITLKVPGHAKVTHRKHVKYPKFEFRSLAVYRRVFDATLERTFEPPTSTTETYQVKCRLLNRGRLEVEDNFNRRAYQLEESKFSF